MSAVKQCSAIVTLVFLLCAAPVSAVPLRSEFGFLEVSTNRHNYSQSIAQLRSGRLVAVFNSSTSGVSAGGISAQIYGVNGTRIGNRITVRDEHNYPVVDQIFDAATVAPLSDGGFVVAWSSHDHSVNNRFIYFRRFDVDGTARDAEPGRVDPDPELHQFTPALAPYQGGFLVVWAYQNRVDGRTRLRSRRVANTGVVLGIPREVASYGHTLEGRENQQPSVAVLQDGGFVVAWRHRRAIDPATEVVFGRKLDRYGRVDGLPLVLSANDGSIKMWPSVAALADGRVVACWSQSTGSTGYDVRCQRHDLTEKSGDEIAVANRTLMRNKPGTVAALAGGGFVVAWDSVDQVNDLVMARRYGPAGEVIGPDILSRKLNEYDGFARLRGAVAPLKDGGFVVSWQSYDYSLDKGLWGAQVHDPFIEMNTWKGANGSTLPRNKVTELLGYADKAIAVYSGTESADCTRYTSLGAVDFVADLCPHGPGNEYVLAFRGTDSLNDWTINISQMWYGTISPIHYDQSLLAFSSAYALLKTRHPQGDYSITMVGHSLGGALAQYATLRAFRDPQSDPVKKVVTFNSAGLSRTTLKHPDFDISSIKLRNVDVTHVINQSDVVPTRGFQIRGDVRHVTAGPLSRYCRNLVLVLARLSICAEELYINHSSTQLKARMIEQW